MKVNDEIRADKVRLIDATGAMVGIVSLPEAQDVARKAGLDLVEISPNAQPPVVKVIDMGKFRYDQQKKLKDNKKAQHQSKIKEVKFKPNIDTHDLETKIRRAKDFLEKKFKVRITCSFRGREMAHPEIGRRVLESVAEALEEYGQIEAPFKMMGRIMSSVIAPAKSRKAAAKTEKKQDQSLPSKTDESKNA